MVFHEQKRYSYYKYTVTMRFLQEKSRSRHEFTVVKVIVQKHSDTCCRSAKVHGSDIFVQKDGCVKMTDVSCNAQNVLYKKHTKYIL